MNVALVVNGDEVLVDAASFSSMAFVLDEALTLSNNLARPASDFELRYETGDLVPAGIRAADLRSQPVFATLALGCGGAS